MCERWLTVSFNKCTVQCPRSSSFIIFWSSAFLFPSVLSLHVTVSFLLLCWLYGKQLRWWPTWPLPSPSLPSLLCFLPQESSYPSTWHRTLLGPGKVPGKPGKEQLQASAFQSSVSACTLFSSVHCLMSHASHVRCWARLFWQAVNPCATHTGDPQNLGICCLLARLAHLLLVLWN